MREALDIQVQGIVQGVGFRPFIYRLARRYLITGWVLNAADGVSIHAEGEAAHLDGFVLEISENPPAASRVTEIEMKEVPLEGFEGFEIRFSDEGEVERTTLVSPDLATCEDCTRELFDPQDRRYRYPFINCTNCGPRFTIIDSLPYDRKSTSMRDFALCAHCAREYGDPLDRRFHAQPDACFACGPHISWRWAAEQSSVCAAENKGEVNLAFRIEGKGKAAPSIGKDEQGEAVPAVGGARKGEVAPEVGRGDYGKAAPSIGKDEQGEAAPAVGCEKNGEGKPAAEGDVGQDAPPVFWGDTRAKSDAIFAEAVAALRRGKILAVKGLGGFHLVCDAANEDALAALRKRKRRKGQAFAVMMPSLEEVRQYCQVNAAEEKLLCGSERPIVLLKKKPGVRFAQGLADGLTELGVMLPYTPIQHILLHDFEGMLVMTSANIHDEPIVTDDEEAYRSLRGIADAFLGHNRAIVSRYDDSVVRVLHVAESGFPIQIIRRARGYAPLPLAFPSREAAVTNADSQGIAVSNNATRNTDAQDAAPQGVTESDGAAQDDAHQDTAEQDRASRNAICHVFATGPEQKNTFCLTREGEAFVSQHIGDMENAEAFDAWLAAKQRYERLFELSPTVIACDYHPEYLTSKWAYEQARVPQPHMQESETQPRMQESETQPRMQERDAQPRIQKRAAPSLIKVQHHHAHIASVMAEHSLEGPVAGFAFDGTGYGLDGQIWGGEALLCKREGFERFANFAYIPMPGGAAAIKHPLRMAFGALWAFDLLGHSAAQATIEELGSQAALCESMIEKGLNTPFTSSVGRLFDAASAILGICTEPRYEGEGAILLEAAISQEEATEATIALGSPREAVSASAHASSFYEDNVQMFHVKHPSQSGVCADAFVTPGSPAEATVSPGSPTEACSPMDAYPIAIIKNAALANSTAQDTSAILMDAAPLFKALLDDKAAGVPKGIIARRFHDAFIQAVLDLSQLVRAAYDIDVIALSGGVFMNRYLIEHLLIGLSQAGFTVAINRDLPPNDGCVSYGQALVAQALHPAIPKA
ncbi:MAG: carbamoyltransferase HypF [Coriobacteriaceae bacterium]|jgi:hydrogenase maturation protein HypF|nr:carbamoyltransferase HypF [Coriobacteriaceae bacterium]